MLENSKPRTLLNGTTDNDFIAAAILVPFESFGGIKIALATPFRHILAENPVLQPKVPIIQQGGRLGPLGIGAIKA
ncbi:MAG TPA: hypothetical protein EYN06_08170 [Myxococcales bacterium]|nr:hypothetical protein [Myxococcales bacterium]